jgi:hypothetical protein
MEPVSDFSAKHRAGRSNGGRLKERPMLGNLKFHPAGCAEFAI